MIGTVQPHKVVIIRNEISDGTALDVNASLDDGLTALWMTEPAIEDTLSSHAALGDPVCSGYHTVRNRMQHIVVLNPTDAVGRFDIVIKFHEDYYLSAPTATPGF